MASGSIVVWQWFDEYGRWRLYDPHVSDYIEQEYAKHITQPKTATPSHSFSLMGFLSGAVPLGRADPSLGCYFVDFPHMIQLRPDTGASRGLQRKLHPSDSPVGKGIVWSYQGEYHGQWIAYPNEVATLLEDAHSKHQKSVNLSPVNMPYTIDLQQLQQINNTTGKKRSIQRTTSAFSYMSTSSAGSIGGSSAAAVTTTTSSSLTALGSASHSGPFGSMSAATSAPIMSHIPGMPSVLMPAHGGVGLGLPIGPIASSSSGAIPTHTSIIGHKKKGAPLGADGSADSDASNRRSKRRRAKAVASTGRVCDNSLPQTTSGSVFNYNSDSNPNDAIGTSAEEVLRSYVTVMDSPPKDEDCCICCESLAEASGYVNGEEASAAPASMVLRLDKCSHMFHKACLTAMYDSGPKMGSLQCPTCKTMYGVKIGNCPPGRMDYSSMPHSLPGHPHCGSIKVAYNIPHGIQGLGHPHPGRPYRTQGFPRVGYLPDDEQGQKVLRLLVKAFERRLTFTIGTSVTTGLTDTVVWNEIHHKTEFGSNHSGHGYPDENYISNVLAELAAQGVVDEEEEGERGKDDTREPLTVL